MRATPHFARSLDDHAAVRSALDDEDGARHLREEATTLAEGVGLALGDLANAAHR